MKQCNTNSGLAILGGALIGAAAMYLLDPETGRKRRSTLGHTVGDALNTARDKALDAGHSVAHMAGDWAGQACDTGYDFAEDAADHAHSAVDSGRSYAAAGISGLAGKVGDFGHNIWDRIRHAGNDASDQATGWYDSLVGKARSMSHPARHRLARTIDPDNVRGSGHAAAWSAAGVGAGAAGVACMYFFDPKSGSERRERCMNFIGSGLTQVSKSSRKLGQAAASQYHKLLGGKEEDRSDFRSEYAAGVSGEELLRRVRLRVGQVLANPTDVQLMTDADGAVTIDGRVPEHERDFLLSCVRSVPGVTRIHNRLQSSQTGSDWSSTASTSETTGLSSPSVSL